MQLTVQYGAQERGARRATGTRAVSRRGLPARASLLTWAKAALARPAKATVTIRFVGRREGRSLNRTYRRRDYATNVLTFAYSRDAGDLVLCAPVVAVEARAQRKPVRAHYAHLVVHGLLHLQGFDHQRDPDARRMQARERTILARLGYPDPYHEHE